MNWRKKYRKGVTLLLTGSLVCGFLSPMRQAYHASADTSTGSVTTPVQTKVSLSQNSLSLVRGKSKKLKLKNAKGKVTWSSKNKKIAVVSKKGVVKAKKIGSTTVIAKYSGKKYKCKVTVTGKTYKLSATSVSLIKGKTKTIYLKNGKKKLKKGISYSSDNKKVVTVSKKGKIKGKGVGAAIITLSCEGKKYYVTVIVNNPEVKHVSFAKKAVSVTAKKSAKSTVGTLAKQGYQLTIPKEAFDKDTKVTVKTDGNKLTITAGSAKYTRLNQPVKVQVKMKKKVPKGDSIYYRGVYYYGGKTYYMPLDGKKLKKGIAEFEIDHFSVVTACKVAKKHIIQNTAYLQAVNDYTADTQNELAAKAAEAYLNSVLDEMGITEARGWGDYRSELNSQISKSSDYIALIRAAKDGSINDFQSAASQLIAKTLCSRIGNYGSAAAGAIPEAIDSARKGDFKGVLKAVGGAISMQNPYVKALAFYKSLVEAGVDTWYNKGMEDAFKAYSGNATQRGAFGYSGNYETGNDEDWARFTGEMRGVYTKYMETEMSFYKKANEISDSEWAAQPELQKTARAVADAKLRKEFDKRKDKKAYIEKLTKENEKKIEAFYDYGLVYHEDERPSWMSEEDEALVVRRLLNVRNSIEQMFSAAGTTPAKAAGRADSMNDKLYAKLVGKWIEKSWIPGMDDPGAGRIAVRDYIAKEWGIGVSIGDKVSTLAIGETHQFNLYVEQTKVSAKWSVSDKEAATVTGKGLVKGIADGIVTLKAVYGKKTHQTEIKVGEGQIELSATKKTLMTGKSFSLTLANRNGSSLLDIPAWSVSDTKLLSLSGNGNTVTVKGLKKGTAQAVAVYHGRKYICTIKVAQTIKLNKTKMTLTVGKTGKLKLLGVKASKVLWGVKDSNGVVSVSDSGKVTAKKKGTATVIAQVKGKKKQYTCKVTVKAKTSKKKTSVVGYYHGTMTENVYTFSTTPARTYTRNGLIVVTSAGNGKYTIVAEGEQGSGFGSYYAAYSSKVVSGKGSSISYSDETTSFSCNGKTASWTGYVIFEDNNGNKTGRGVYFKINATKTSD